MLCILQLFMPAVMAANPADRPYIFKALYYDEASKSSKPASYAEIYDHSQYIGATGNSGYFIKQMKVDEHYFEATVRKGGITYRGMNHYTGTLNGTNYVEIYMFSERLTPGRGFQFMNNPKYFPR
jgi:hypothetical protein